MPELYDHLPPLATRQEAEREERRLAKRLRKLGYVVEGGHMNAVRAASAS